MANEILMAVRSSKKTNGEISLNEPIGTDREGNEITLMDILHGNENEIYKKVEKNIETKKMLSKMSKVLKPREKKILEMRYGLNGYDKMTQKEIADLMGISRSYVSRIESRAVKKLSKEMKN